MNGESESEEKSIEGCGLFVFFAIMTITTNTQETPEHMPSILYDCLLSFLGIMGIAGNSFGDYDQT